MNKLNQNKAPLFEAVKAYDKEQVIPFDVPGHKHGEGLKEFRDFFGSKILELDVNSMECLDNICNPIGVIKEAEDLAAAAYNGKKAFFLVNGTTSGVQTMIMSVCKPGEKIILPRNAHKSTTAALILSGAIPVYIQPEINTRLGIAMGFTIESLQDAIQQNPDAKAIFLVHPTYYGAVSDIKSIVELAHANNMFVLADEAHGAHFNFHPEFPLSATTAGADIASISLHKTGGSLTQSSLLVLNNSNIDASTIKSFLNLTQTTSASYLLMTSLDLARKQLATQGQEMLGNVLNLARRARNEINALGGYYAFGKELTNSSGCYDFDESKLGINVSELGLTGYDLEKILRSEYQIQVELADLTNILCIISLGDNWPKLQKLINALQEIKTKYAKAKKKLIVLSSLQNPEVIVPPREAFYSSKQSVQLMDSIGEISGEAVMAYPPGIPIIAPGEKITEEIIDYIELLKKESCMLQGTADPYINNIQILKFPSY